jgi:hypothetical protein
MFNTPIAILGYARPKETNDLISILRELGARKVYYFVDYPKSNNPDLVNNNKLVRELAGKIDWECKVKKVFFPKNLGPWNAYMRVLETVFEQEDRIIYLEDDKFPTKSFFYFCEELLEKYESDKRVSLITGNNRFENYPPDYEKDYFFATNNHHGGHAMWKRTYETFFNYQIIYENNYYFNLYKTFFPSRSENKIRTSQLLKIIKEGRYKGAPPSMEFYNYGPVQFLENALVVVPTKNMVQEVGVTIFTVHGDEAKLLTSRQRRLYHRKIHELDFPLNHPDYIVEDRNYYKDRFQDGIVLLLMEKTERFFKILIYKGPRSLIRKIISKVKIFLNKEY